MFGCTPDLIEGTIEPPSWISCVSIKLFESSSDILTCQATDTTINVELAVAILAKGVRRPLRSLVPTQAALTPRRIGRNVLIRAVFLPAKCSKYATRHTGLDLVGTLI